MTQPKPISRNQLRAARALLDLTQATVCERLDMPVITLRRIEGRPDHKGLVSDHSLRQLRKFYEAQGVQFLDQGDGEGGEGVRLRSPRSAGSATT
ncbi:XRE family transcriptional regulator [Rhodobaculum claviforme]|uniref:Helix-turn-helix domain-containing protein n=1 Tax=Rhodobaculum claviforme TaxID=1549854 RepID=A0A934TKQ4_9RHOB|nr:XRE family transcriptional regulator [Rhodobaculum claviforme]MBK5927339.1 hypothetical protein [Rhodobaculum claviforme]